jgi:diguanylate cyclase (GGDEF)-like protein
MSWPRHLESRRPRVKLARKSAESLGVQLRTALRRFAGRLTLTRQVAVLSLVPMIVLALVLARALQTQIVHQTLADETQSARLLARIGIQPRLTPSELRHGLSAATVATLDQQLRTGVVKRDLARIKIWNAQDTVVYSDDHSLIGRRLEPSDELEHAFDGKPNPAVVVNPAPHTETAGEVGLGTLVEVYVPLRFADSGPPAGVFEIYLSYRPIAGAIRRDKQAIVLLVAIGLAALWLVLYRIVARTERRLRQQTHENHTDALTGLANRRALMRDLEKQLASASEEHPLILGMFDLNGFKQYNDTFGHPSGDALLARLGERLRTALADSGVAYRMGGDEFCVLAEGDAREGAAIARRAASALCEQGEAFAVDCSYGLAYLPRDATSPSDALRVSDQRMYEHKAGRSSASRQSSDVLLKVLEEHSPGLNAHIGAVAQLARTTAEQLGLPEVEVNRIELAAELHDIGKVAVPSTILNKPGPLTAEEWDFVRRHCEIGERIVSAAPALAHTAELVRHHHERYDGGGYPDGRAKDDLPIGASVIAVCDAFSAMISKRPYSDAVSVADALSELRRCSGSQFHPLVVTAFCEMVEAPAQTPAATA